MFCLVCGVLSAAAGSPFPAEVDSLIRGGIDLTFRSRFEEARVRFLRVMERYPAHPVGYFYQAAALQSKMLDYETDLWEEDFLRLAEEGLGLGEAAIEAGGADAWTYFYTGSIYTYKALYRGRTGSIVAGFFSARTGVKYLETAVEMDSTLYDAYLGIGSYKYWASRYMKWLPWVRDEREEGIRLVRRAIDRGSYSRWIGLNSLAWIEYDRAAYADALILFREGLDRFPGSRFFLWGTADTYFRLGQYEHAAEGYAHILDVILGMVYNNGFNEAVCRFKLAKTHMADRRYADAVAQCDVILGLEAEPDVVRRLKGRIQATEKMRQRCLERMEADGKRGDERER